MMADDKDRDQKGAYSDLAAGTLVSHYKILSKIGAGGMGEVYLAEDTELDRKVALKFLPPHLNQDQVYRKRFKREAQSAAKLNHPNIVTIYDVGEFEDRPFLSMAFIDGRTLAQFKSERIPSIESLVSLGIQMADALAAAHEQGIIHRDLKPGNILVDSADKVHILDFGLAKLAGSPSQKNTDDANSTLTSPGDIIGTVPYMAPEQLMGRDITHLSDIFSMGVILYELCCGDRPFGGASNAELATSILRDKPAPISEKRHDTPYDLGRIISRCLHKEPDKRFQSVKDIKNELSELQELMDLEEAPADIDKALATGRRALVDANFVLTADLVRKLNHKSPQMIGDSLSYFDNNVDSDILIVVFHGLGLDKRQFMELLYMLPYRGIAPSLYGFDFRDSRRPALTIEDHSILLRAFLKDIESRFNPKCIILCGHSTGADHILHLAEMKEEIGVKVSGLISYGCNTNLESCLFSSRLSKMEVGNEKEIIEAIREFGLSVDSLNDYLTVCEYCVMGFTKFGADIEAVKQFSIGIARPFETYGWDQFPRWYKSAIEKVPHVRFVFSEYEIKALDKILGRHLEDNILGDYFREDTIIRENVSHLGLSDPELMLKHIRALVDLIESQS